MSDTEIARVVSRLEVDRSGLKSGLSSAMSDILRFDKESSHVLSNIGSGFDNTFKKNDFKRVGQEMADSLMGPMASSFGSMGGLATSAAAALGPVGIALGTITAGTVAIGSAATQAAMAWESLGSQVGRTTSLKGQELANLMNDLQDVRVEMGLTKQEAAAMAEQAGSLGVGESAKRRGDMVAYRKELSEFVKTNAIVAGAFGMSKESTATGLGALGAATVGRWNEQRAEMGRQELSWSVFAENVGGSLDQLGNNMGSSEEGIITALTHISESVNDLAPTEADYGKWAGLASFMVELTPTSPDTAGESIKDAFNWIQRDKDSMISSLLGTDQAGVVQKMKTDAVGTVKEIGKAIAALPPEDRIPLWKGFGDTGAKMMKAVVADIESGTDRLDYAIELGVKGFNEGDLRSAFAEVADDATFQAGRISEAFQVALEKAGTMGLPAVSEGLAGIADGMVSAISTGERLYTIFSDISGTPFVQQGMGLAGEMSGALWQGTVGNAWSWGDQILSGAEKLLGIEEPEEHKQLGTGAGELYMAGMAYGITSQSPMAKDAVTNALGVDLFDAVENAGKEAGGKTAQEFADAFQAGLDKYKGKVSDELLQYIASAEAHGEFIADEASNIELLEKYNKANKETPIDWTPWEDRGVGKVKDTSVVEKYSYVNNAKGKPIKDKLIDQYLTAEVDFDQFGKYSVSSGKNLMEELQAEGATLQQAAALTEKVIAGNKTDAEFQRYWLKPWEELKAANPLISAAAADYQKYTKEFLDAPEVDWENKAFSKWVQTLPVDLQTIQTFSDKTQRALYNIYKGTDIHGTKAREGGILSRNALLSMVGDDESLKTAENITDSWDAILAGLQERSLDNEAYTSLKGRIEYLKKQPNISASDLDSVARDLRIANVSYNLKNLWESKQKGSGITLKTMFGAGLTDIDTVMSDIATQASDAFSDQWIDQTEATGIIDRLRESQEADIEGFKRLGGDASLKFWEGISQKLTTLNLVDKAIAESEAAGYEVPVALTAKHDQLVKEINDAIDEQYEIEVNVKTIWEDWTSAAYREKILAENPALSSKLTPEQGQKWNNFFGGLGDKAEAGDKKAEQALQSLQILMEGIQNYSVSSMGYVSEAMADIISYAPELGKSGSWLRKWANTYRYEVLKGLPTTEAGTYDPYMYSIWEEQSKYGVMWNTPTEKDITVDMVTAVDDIDKLDELATEDAVKKVQLEGIDLALAQADELNLSLSSPVEKVVTVRTENESDLNSVVAGTVPTTATNTSKMVSIGSGYRKAVVGSDFLAGLNRYASGGYVDEEQLAVVGEEPELIIPVSDLEGLYPKSPNVKKGSMEYYSGYNEFQNYPYEISGPNSYQWSKYPNPPSVMVSGDVPVAWLSDKQYTGMDYISSEIRERQLRSIGNSLVQPWFARGYQDQPEWWASAATDLSPKYADAWKAQKGGVVPKIGADTSDIEKYDAWSAIYDDSGTCIGYVPRDESLNFKPGEAYLPGGKWYNGPSDDDSIQELESIAGFSEDIADNTAMVYGGVNRLNASINAGQTGLSSVFPILRGAGGGGAQTGAMSWLGDVDDALTRRTAWNAIYDNSGTCIAFVEPDPSLNFTPGKDYLPGGKGLGNMGEYATVSLGDQEISTWDSVAQSVAASLVCQEQIEENTEKIRDYSKTATEYQSKMASVFGVGAAGSSGNMAWGSGGLGSGSGITGFANRGGGWYWGGTSISGGGAHIGGGASSSGWGAQASAMGAGASGASIGGGGVSFWAEGGAVNIERGGLVDQPTLFLADGRLNVVGETKKPELILPLSDPRRTKELLRQYLPEVRGFAEGGLVGGTSLGSGSVTVNYTGPTINGAGLSEAQIMRILERDRKEFKTEIEEALYNARRR